MPHLVSTLIRLPLAEDIASGVTSLSRLCGGVPVGALPVCVDVMTLSILPALGGICLAS